MVREAGDEMERMEEGDAAALEGAACFCSEGFFFVLFCFVLACLVLSCGRKEAEIWWVWARDDDYDIVFRSPSTFRGMTVLSGGIFNNYPLPLP